MIRRFVAVLSLAVVCYLGTIIVVHAQGSNARLDERERQIERETTSNTSQLGALQERVRVLEEQSLDRRLSVLEVSAATNTKLLIGLSIGMFPILLDIFRRWGRSEPPAHSHKTHEMREDEDVS